MPYFALGYFGPVRLRPDSPRRKEVAVGAIKPAFSGRPRSTIREHLLAWENAETDWYERSEADALREEMRSAQPIAASGDLTGSIDVFIADIQEVEKVRAAIGGTSTEMVRIGFTILAAEPVA